ncbi:hypothetical protein IU474_19900 [Nocardia otitidiscaviarum]|uniref:hypothetical protein n=1 Tax=Nocardia otitidiscaviarum TaxID=1823 RepID=UPI0018948768|nr:hypothetical protein [Nocardia otitidiscaviarum]MBF6239313.1 hypothetical protein [Nocardia otitidiscaviarum]
MVNDVEKRWSDPKMFRHAAWYVGGVVVLTALAVAVLELVTDPSRAVIVFVPGTVLLVGGIVAFVLALRAWRRRGAWPIWQGAGWFLFTLMVVYLAIASGTG